MRIRFGCFAVLVAAALMVSGCGGEKKGDPPPGTNTDTPTLDIDEGIPAPGDPDTGDEKKKEGEEGE